MRIKVLCKVCKTITDYETGSDNTYCNCGNTWIETIKDDDGINRPKINYNREGYALVDDKGNEIMIRGEIDKSSGHNEIFNQLMIGLKSQIDFMENLSPSMKFSPATNQDLLAHLLWTQSVLQVLERLCGASKKSKKKSRKES